MSHTFVLVQTGERKKLVHIDAVREIVAMMAVEDLDERTGRCRGMVNLRGDVVPVFDATGSDAPLHPRRFILIAPMGDGPVGLVVDDVLDVVAVPEDHVLQRPVGPGRSARLVRIDHDLFPVLEPTDVVTQPL